MFIGIWEKAQNQIQAEKFCSCLVFLVQCLYWCLYMHFYLFHIIKMVDNLILNIFPDSTDAHASMQCQWCKFMTVCGNYMHTPVYLTCNHIFSGYQYNLIHGSCNYGEGNKNIVKLRRFLECLCPPLPPYCSDLKGIVCIQFQVHNSD